MDETTEHTEQPAADRDPGVEEVIPVLRVTDVAVSAAWYARLGFTLSWEYAFGAGFPVFAEIARNRRARLYLSEHEGDARPDTLVHIRVQDVDAVAAAFGATVTDEPWARELELTDPDGNRLRVGTPHE
jgi:hypothetical protein